MVSLESTTALDAQISQADALRYWNSIPATVNGMLGGFPHVSRIDLRGSSVFFEKLRRLHSLPPPSQLQRGVDCGAGIGRITAGFLSKVCQIVDIVEPVEKFASEVRSQKMSGEGKVGEVYMIGLQDWIPSEKYDVIWIQWCLGHLTDQELEKYLSRCLPVLKSGGWIVVKENVSTDPDGEDMFDEEDSSVTRTDAKFRSLFEMVGLKISKTEVQTGFPKGLYPVKFYALQPE
ncbi:MAG: hypothetical protein LQ350_003965 [Teloschistes chrysophthalmus]|nr:MAG: hypothetical protein LQ350_003965 [Niorma chrysophthalma]